MTEKIITLTGIDPVEFYGANNSTLDVITRNFPKLKIIARGDTLKALGDDAEIERFDEKIKQILEHLHQYNRIDNVDLFFNDNSAPVQYDLHEIIIHGSTGKPIKAKTPNQFKLIDEYKKNDLIIVVGPAGTGKTYMSIALAVRALKNREVKKIILSRPAVEAEEHLGFLPGSLNEKLDPYLQPLFDALNDMIPAKKLAEYFDDGVIQIAPIAYMRGRTLDNAFVILDEAQNATITQLKMFLTRMGEHARFVVTGDLTQIDLPGNRQSGLLQAIRILKDIDGISIVEFDNRDIARHKLVKHIVNAYEKEKENGKPDKN